MKQVRLHKDKTNQMIKQVHKKKHYNYNLNHNQQISKRIKLQGLITIITRLKRINFRQLDNIRTLIMKQAVKVPLRKEMVWGQFL